MFRFAHPDFLYLLFLLPVLVAFYVYAIVLKKKAIKKYGNPELLAELMPEVSPKRQHLKFWLLFGAITMVIIVMAGPQFGSKLETVKRQGVEIMVCLDVSNSMLAEDVSPDRLSKAKQMLSKLTDGFSNDKVGLIVFAGDAFTQLPITSDYVSAKMFIHDISPSLITTQGTDLARAINLSASSFTQQQGVGRAIIVITDGEDHEGGAEEAVKAARKKGINVFILGIGSTKGAPIPVGGDYLKDASGNVVMSALNEDMCRSLAQAGSGSYIHVDNTNDAQEKLNSELAKLQKGTTQDVVYSEYADQFQAFGLIVFLLLIVEACLLEAKNPRFKNVFLFKKKS